MWLDILIYVGLPVAALLGLIAWGLVDWAKVETLDPDQPWEFL